MERTQKEQQEWLWNYLLGLVSKRSADLYMYILNFKMTHDGNSPTAREACKGIGVNSTFTINYHLHKLADAGLVEIPTKEERKASRIVIVGGEWRLPLEM